MSLVVKNLQTKIEDQLILKDLSFTAESNERIAVIGQNGSGKSTLAKTLNGMLRTTAGDILYNGLSIKELSISKRSHLIAYAFQNPDDQIFSDKVLKEIQFPYQIRKIAPKDYNRQVNEIAEVIGLTDYLETHPYDLPYSVRKLVSLASTLATNSKVIILDEPTAGQDIYGLQAIQSVLDHFKDRLFFVITHDMEFVNENFERILVLSDGKLLFDGTPSTLFTDNEVVKKGQLISPFEYKIKQIGEK